MKFIVDAQLPRRIAVWLREAADDVDAPEISFGRETGQVPSAVDSLGN